MTYRAQQGIFIGRPPCECGAAYRLHRDGACPVPYRPPTIQSAERDLRDAERSGDANRIFIARGEVQRLRGRRARS